MKRVGITKKLAKDIRKARLERLMTQAEVAKATGMTRYGVILMEKGEHVPRGDRFVKLIKLLSLETRI